MEPLEFIVWIGIGTLTGWLAKRVTPGSVGLSGTIFAGIVGACLGGLLFHGMRESGVTGFSIWSVLIAFVVAVVLLYLFRLVQGRTSIPTE